MYYEILSGAQGTFKVPKYTPIRVRAVGATTVTIDGVLAVTMMANEIIIINVGGGDNTDTDRRVTVVIAGANAFVQIGQQQERQPREDLIV